MMTEMFEFDQAHKQLINFKDKNSKLSSCFYKLASKQIQISEFVEFMLKNGADPNEPDENGNYPLEYAIISSIIDMVTALIDSDKIDFTKKLNRNPNKKASLANVSSKQRSYSYSYLHVAVINEQILSMFLDKKLIDVNITDSNGETPLMIACRYKNNESVNLLFTVDELDYKHRNNEGKDALEICMQLFKGTCNDPHETKEQYHECLLNIIKKKEYQFSFKLKKSVEEKYLSTTSKFDQSVNKNLSLTTSIFGQPSENTANQDAHKQSNNVNPSFSSHKPVESIISNISNSHSNNIQANVSDSSAFKSTQKVKNGSETHIDDEIVAAICDTLNLKGLTHDQAVKITERFASISAKRGKEFSDTFSSEKTLSNKSNENETIQQREEEIKGDFDDGFTDESLFDDQNGNSFHDPSCYQNQMMMQQWNQMMQIGNMRDFQFNMIMQQQGLMMIDIARRKSKNSSTKQKSKKRKNHK